MERSCSRTENREERGYPARRPGRLTGSGAKIVSRISPGNPTVARSDTPGETRRETSTPLSPVSAHVEIDSGAGQGTTPGTRSCRHARHPCSSPPSSCQPLGEEGCAVTCLWRARSVFAGQDARAMPCSAAPGGAIMVRRMNAVMPTAIAPTVAKTTCKVSDGMVSFTMPKVAW